MSVLYIVLSILVILTCAALNVLILMQKKRTAGLSGSMAGMGASQAYWDKNKSRSLEGTLEKWSKILGAAFMIVCFALNLVH